MGSSASLQPTSLTTLPSLPLFPNPAMMVPPMFPPGGMMPMEMRQPPLGGRMSPGPRDRSYNSRSPSPEYERGYRGSSGRYHDRDASPTSRSERRASPPRHRGGSPARSERYYGGSNGDRAEMAPETDILVAVRGATERIDTGMIEIDNLVSEMVPKHQPLEIHLGIIPEHS